LIEKTLKRILERIRKKKGSMFCGSGHYFDEDDGCKGCGRSIDEILNARRDVQ
jgi:hypothetical protein